MPIILNNMSPWVTYQTASGPPPPPPSKKDPLGHWVMLTGQQDHGVAADNWFKASATCETNLTEGQSATNPTTGLNGVITGYCFRYQWKELEPTQGSYNLGAGSQVDSDITWCSKNGLYYIMLIIDRNFSATLPLPAYMDSLSTAYPMQLSFLIQAGNGAGGTGYSAMRHKPEYSTRMKVMIDKIAAIYDNMAANTSINSWFAGVMFQETSIGTTISGNSPFASAPIPPTGTYTDTNAKYTADLYKANIIDYQGYANTSLGNSRVWFMHNTLAGNNKFIGDIISAIGSDIRVGGPDLMPDLDNNLTGGAANVVMPVVGTGISSTGTVTGKAPIWGSKTAPYNWYTNGWHENTDAFHTKDLTQPLGAVQIGAKTFCTVSADSYHDPMISGPYHCDVAANGGLGITVTGTELPVKQWQAGDLSNWGRRNLGLDYLFWYISDIGTNNDTAKAIAANPFPFSHSS